jgi:CrcB protein
MIKILSLVVGSVAGGLARYYMAGSAHRFFGPTFPYGTLIVNLTGCFLIGFLSALAEGKFAMSQNLKLLLMVGFCGAFTTFSTFMLETGNLMKDGEALRAFMNVFLSFVIGFILFKAGVALGELI